MRTLRGGNSEAGFSLMELIVTIGLAAVIFTVFSATISASYLLRKSTYVIQAGNFLREEIDALRALPFTALVNQTDGPFLGLSLTRGSWQVKTMSSPPSGTQALALDTTVSALSGNETGMIVIPGNYREDFDLTAKLFVDPSSPSNAPWGWGAGIAFHYQDSQNHYRVRYRSSGLAFSKVVNGTVTDIWTENAAYNTNTWYTLRIVATGTSYTFYKNGSSIGSTSDSTFTTGDLGIFSFNDAKIAVDDISVVDSLSSSSWDFDADTTGALPTDWQRFVYVDLPSGAGTLTIADYNGLSTIKQVTATVSWNEGGNTKSVSGSTLIAE